MSAAAGGRRRGVRAALLLGVLAAGVVLTWSAVVKDTSELPVYVRAASRLVSGGEIYRPAEPKTFSYPPFFALPFVPLVGFSEPWQRGLFGATNVLLAVACVALLRRALGPALAALHGRRRVLFWILLGLLAGRHVAAVFQNQSHDLVVLALLLLASGSFPRPASGAWAGLATACKATPALLLMPLVLRRRAAAAGSLAAVALAATLLPDLLFARGDGSLWVQVWLQRIVAGASLAGTGSDPALWLAHSNLDQSLSGTLHRLTHPVGEVEPSAAAFVHDVALVDLEGSPAAAAVVLLVGRLLVLALVALPFVVRRGAGGGGARPGSAGRGVGEVGAVACGMLLLSPVSSKSHFCALVLPTAWLLVRLLAPGPGLRPGWRRRVVVALLAASFVAGVLTSKGIVGKELGRVLLSAGAVTWSACAVLAAVVLGLLEDPGRGPAGPRQA